MLCEEIVPLIPENLKSSTQLNKIEALALAQQSFDSSYVAQSEILRDETQTRTAQKSTRINEELAKNLTLISQSASHGVDRMAQSAESISWEIRSSTTSTTMRSG